MSDQNPAAEPEAASASPDAVAEVNDEQVSNSAQQPGDDPETFPREYVQKLRDESAKYRQRASDRDALAERLHTALVAATGRLADPTDLTFDDVHLTDADALTAAIDDLLARKPHLVSRRIVGDVGQGAQQVGNDVDLAGILRHNAN